MKSLREYQLNLTTDHSSNRPLAWGTLPHEIPGTVNGVAVVAVCLADVPGASPTFLCNDVETGTWALVKIADFIGTYTPQTEGTTRQTMAGSTR